MEGHEEAEKLRREDEEADRLLGLPDTTGDEGAASLVANTVALSSYPTTAAAYYGVKPAAVFGAEVEGQPGTSTPFGRTFLALNLGTAIPPAGTGVIVTFIQNRWVFRHDG